MSVSIASRAGYNVVALLGQAGQVLEQYVWDPYGTPLIKDTSATPAPVNRVGHQGLFWHSLDGSATFNTPDPAATPTATGLYYNRNRWYAPHLGRFLQRDPAATALPLTLALARNGRAIKDTLLPFNVRFHFVDGLNPYLYVAGNPLNRLDPAGLFSAGELGTSMGISGLLGGMTGAFSAALRPDGNVLSGFITGGIAGAAGGGAGYAVSAFAASASGLLGTIMQHGASKAIMSGGVGGGVSSGLSDLFNGGNLSSVVANTFFGMALGGAAGGAGYGTAWLRDATQSSISRSLPDDLIEDVGSLVGSIVGAEFGVAFSTYWDYYQEYSR